MKTNPNVVTFHVWLMASVVLLAIACGAWAALVVAVVELALLAWIIPE